MKLLKVLFSWKNLLPTLLVIAASLVMARLGIWQLDRLAQRRAFNARVLAWVYADPLILDEDSLSEDLYDMEYRTVDVTGQYNFDEQVALRLQQNASQPGVHLLTPLLVEGTQRYVLVDRGWVPLADGDPDHWGVYDTPGDAQPVRVHARIRRAQTGPDFGHLVDPTLTPDQARLDAWYAVNPERIAEQSGLDMIGSVYLQALPDDTDPSMLPLPQADPVEVTEGPHLGYAFQWFLFSAILLVGYPWFLMRQSRRGTLEGEDGQGEK